MKIFIIEDDLKIRTELSTLLNKYGYQCAATDNFADSAREAVQSKSQLILLDINLPQFDGYHICREIRKKSNVPIIMVTSRDSDLDELMSMNLGADDFVVKPYNTEILLARIAAVLKRTQGGAELKTMNYREVTLDISRSVIGHDERLVELTKNEMRIMQLLLQKQGAIVPRDALMLDLWQSDEFVDENTLTVNVNRLRKKLENIGVKDFIITKRGQGYMV